MGRDGRNREKGGMMKRKTLGLIWSICFCSCFLAAAGSEEIGIIIQSGDLARLQALAEKDPALLQFKDDRGRTLLHGAAAAGQVEMARWLIAKGGEVDARTLEMSTPLMAAALSGKPDMVRLLIAKGADLGARDGYQRTAFILVARETGDADMAAILLDAGADINAVDRFNDTALSLAAWRGFGALTDVLLERGATLPADPGQKQQLFTLAITNGLDKLFDRILDAGADTTATDNVGGTLLHAAADGGSEHILNALIGKKLSPNLKDHNGWTPLHRAAERGRPRAAALLIQHAAKLNERTLAGETPYNLALAENNSEVAAMLRSRGGDQSPPRFPKLKGEYLGQKTPGAKPELFAPGIVSSRFGLHCTATFSPDGREAYWNLMIEPRTPGYSISRLLVSRLQDGRWTYPQIASFTGEGKDADVPFFTPDGKRLYFMSRRPLPSAAESTGEHIWYMERQGDGWTKARPLDETVNRLPQHWQFSVDKDYNLYFSTTISGGQGRNDIYCSKYQNGRYAEPQNLGAPVNSSGREEMPFIAADGSYLLFAREMDLYVSFRRSDGSWAEPASLGPEINSPAIDICPQVSADGKYLFFTSQRGGESHTWWAEAKVIEALRPGR
jgi:ankyrin repeat protein